MAVMTFLAWNRRLKWMVDKTIGRQYNCGKDRSNWMAGSRPTYNNYKPSIITGRMTGGQDLTSYTYNLIRGNPTHPFWTTWVKPHNRNLWSDRKMLGYIKKFTTTKEPHIELPCSIATLYWKKRREKGGEPWPYYRI